MRISERFNRSAFGRFLTSPSGRAFRMAAGAGFLMIGYPFRAHWIGAALMLYGLLPLSAGAFDLCFVSALLGGPITGKKIRELQQKQLPPARPPVATPRSPTPMT